MIPIHAEKVDYSLDVMETFLLFLCLSLIFQSSLLSSGVPNSHTSLNLNSFLESDLRYIEAQCYGI